MYGCGKDCLILIPFRLPQISSFTLSLKCFSSDSDNFLDVGIGPLLQFPKDTGSLPGWRRSCGVGNGNPLQCSCLENSMDRGTWQATFLGVSKSHTLLSMHMHVQVVKSKIVGCSVNLLLVEKLSFRNQKPERSNMRS